MRGNVILRCRLCLEDDQTLSFRGSKSRNKVLGTGKSYLLNTLIMFLNNKNYQGLAVTWTGIPANLLI